MNKLETEYTIEEIKELGIEFERFCNNIDFCSECKFDDEDRNEIMSVECFVNWLKEKENKQMYLEEFLEQFFVHIMAKDGLERLKEFVKKEMQDVSLDYSGTKVKTRKNTGTFDFNKDIEINSDFGAGGERGLLAKNIFIDIRIDELED